MELYTAQNYAKNVISKSFKKFEIYYFTSCTLLIYIQHFYISHV